LSFFFWPLYCLFFCLLAIVLSVLLSFGHCIVCSSTIYGFWLPLWYLLTLLTQNSTY
jgi:lipopolysaccharide export LptBFGC system permease protein LptF